MNAEQSRAAYAVLEAALHWDDSRGFETDPLDEAIEAYRKLIATAPAESPLPWGRVCAGDQIRAKDGQWYEVIATAEKPGDVITKITVKLPNGPVTLTKERAVSTTVRRGDAGRAADLFGDAFGGAEVMAS